MRTEIMWLGVILAACLALAVSAEINPGYHAVIDGVLQPINDSFSAAIDNELSGFILLNNLSSQVIALEQQTLSPVTGFNTFFGAVFKPVTDSLPLKVKAFISFCLMLGIIGVYLRWK